MILGSKLIIAVKFWLPRDKNIGFISHLNSYLYKEVFKVLQQVQKKLFKKLILKYLDIYGVEKAKD